MERKYIVSDSPRGCLSEHRGSGTTSGFIRETEINATSITTGSSSMQKTPVALPSGGGFGPTIQLADGTLVTSLTYCGENNETRIEVVRWQLPGSSPLP